MITVYATPRETNYPGAAASVTGCEDYCAPGTERQLGAYSGAFLDQVRAHGTGFLERGPYAGRYLNWSSGVGGSGYWVSTAARSASGAGLVSMSSAAATSSLNFGGRFVIVDCGRNAFGGAINGSVCNDFSSTTWTVTDRFEPGANSRPNQLDLYVGVETAGQRFETSPYAITWESSVIEPR
jgi:phage-related tail fiber protein